MTTDADRGETTSLSQDRARQLTQELLDATSWVDRFELQSDLELFVVEFLQRCRRLARAFRVLDADDDEHVLEQEILLRALTCRGGPGPDTLTGCE